MQKEVVKESAIVTFDQALAGIRAKAGITGKKNTAMDDEKRTVQLGTDFEKMIVEYLKHDSIYGSEFEQVKRWYDWYQEPDTGIDIVARDVKGDLVGIQCKCWADDSVLDLQDISTMFTTAKAKNIDKLMLVFTGDALTTHTQKRCDEAHVRTVTKADLRASRFDWSTAAKARGRRSDPVIYGHIKKRPSSRPYPNSKMQTAGSS